MKKNYMSLLLALAMILALFAGCGGTSATTSDAGSAPEASAAETQEETAAAPEEAEAVPETAEDSAEEAASDLEEAAEPEIDTSFLPDSYPLMDDGSTPLSIFQETNPMMGLDVETYGELPFWQELASRTGVVLDWNMISFASSQEQFFLLVAANDLPNIAPLSYYTEGITKAVEDEIFVNIAGYLEEYAPHYYQLVQRKDVHPMVYDENGNAVAFYEIADEQFPPNNGVFLRGDLLEEQGLEVPKTYDEYEDVLLKLKSAYDMEAPLYYYNMAQCVLTAGKGIRDTFTLTPEGEVIYGPTTDKWRECMEIIRGWYDKDLIYKEFFAVPSGMEISYMVEHVASGKSAFSYGYCEFAGMITLSDPDGYLAPGHLPRENHDDQVHISDGVDALISRGYALGPNSTEEEIELACMFFNYLYTDEGALLSNFGVEGETFEYDENGEPWYTDLIIDNPDGLTQTQALVYYTGYFFPCHADLIKYNISTVTNWADFVEVWASADDTLSLPTLTLTQDEQEEYAKLSNDVDTYMDETITKMEIGDLDIYDDAVWQEYLDTMDSLGAGRMLEIYRAAYDRYLAS